MARKPSSRCLPMNVKVKMDGRPPPDDCNPSPLDFVQENFETFNIRTRKKEVKSDDIKEVCSGEDSDLQEVDMFEKWSSSDRNTFDGSESSEWERSVSSSMSWFDESEYEATLKVKGMLDNIDCMLFGEPYTTLPKEMVEECQQWKQRFPHLRIIGTRVAESVTHDNEKNQISSEHNNDIGKEKNVSPPRERLEHSVEDQEEVYACHGNIEPQQDLSHEFNLHESSRDPESERIKEELLNALTTHVWKEVFVPSLKRAFELRNSTIESSLPMDRRDQNVTPAVNNKYICRNADLKSHYISNKQFQCGKSLSAREEGTGMQNTKELIDPVESYRRYSDQLSYCDVKCGDSFVSLEIVGEKDNQELNNLKKGKILRNSRKDSSSIRSMEVKVKGEASSRTAPQQRRIQSSSRRSKQVGVVEELFPIGKGTAWTSSIIEDFECSDSHQLHKENKHLILPAIEHQRVPQSYEPASYCIGRSSSALPKLPYRNFRPTSSYQNKALLQANKRKDQNMKHYEDNLSNYSWTQMKR